MACSLGLALGPLIHRSTAFSGTSWKTDGSCTSIRRIAFGVSAAAAQFSCRKIAMAADAASNSVSPLTVTEWTTPAQSVILTVQA